LVPKAQNSFTDRNKHRFTILEAEGGITGRFAAIADTALLKTSLIYGNEAAAALNAAPAQVLSIEWPSSGSGLRPWGWKWNVG